MSDENPQNEEVNATPIVEEPVSQESDAPAGAVSDDAQSEAQPITIESLKPGMAFDGTVKSIDLYGAFVDIGAGKDGLLHISQLGKPNVRNVEDVVSLGETVKVYVLKVDVDNKRIALSTEKPPENPISSIRQGDVVTGKVVRIENFGAFVDIGAERPGMIHVSELASDYIESPEDVVKVDQEIQAKVIKVNRKKRQIDLSIKALEEAQNAAEIATAMDGNANESDEAVPTAMELALRRAMGGSDDESGGQRSRGKKGRGSRRSKRALDDALSRTLKHNN